MKLQRRHLEAILDLIGGEAIEAVCAKREINLKRLAGWLEDPDFVASYRNALRNNDARLRALARACLEELLRDKDSKVRLRAATAIMNLVEEPYSDEGPGQEQGAVVCWKEDEEE